MTRAVAIALAGSMLCRAAWVRVDSPGIELFSYAGEKPARLLLERFETIRGVFRQAGIADGPLRLRVFLFSSQEELHRFRDGVDGFFQAGTERDYIALHTGPEAGRVAYHEYVHLILKHSAVALPKWFDEGTAEFYSTVEVEKAALRIGNAIPSHVERLAQTPSLSAAAIRGGSGDPLFYAESWALVHMLNLAPRWRDGLPRFVLLLSEEKQVEESFRQAFGRTIADAIAALPAYLKTMGVAKIPMALEGTRESRVTHVSNDDGSIACAGLALAMNRPSLAEAFVANIGDSAASEAMRGTIALAQNRREEARRRLDRAMELGNRDASLYFEYAILEEESGRPNAELLRKVIAIDPDFADAQFLLGVRATDDRRYTQAIDHLRAAVRVRPERSNYWHALGYAQARAGQRDASRGSARRALATAEDDQEEKMAKALADLPDDAPAPALSKSPVTTPSSWQGAQGDARIEGTLVNFVCDSNPPRLEVRDASGAATILLLQRANEIELLNAPQATLTLPCGVQNLRVTIDYQAASRNVTRIEFRL